MNKSANNNAYHLIYEIHRPAWGGGVYFCVGGGGGGLLPMWCRGCDVSVFKVKGGCKWVSEESQCTSAVDSIQMEDYFPFIIPPYP